MIISEDGEMDEDSPAGTSTFTNLRILTLPIPSQSPQLPPRGTLLPVPWHVPQVEAIWKPLSITNVLVPVPPHVVHVVRLIPGFKPLPEQLEQFAIGVILIARLIPFAASMKLIPILASRSSPR